MNTALKLVKPELTSFGTPDSFASAWDLYTEEQNETLASGVQGDAEGPSAAVQDALKSFYDDIKENLAERADEFVYIIKDAIAQEKTLKIEAGRLQAMAKQFSAKADKVKELLKHAMEASNIPKVKTGKHTLNVQNPGEKAPVDIYAEMDSEGVPDLVKKYLKEVTTTRVLTDDIRADFKAGIAVEGACLPKREKILVIK